MKKILKCTLCVIWIILLTSCNRSSSEFVMLNNPTINCQEIVITDNEELDFRKYCAISPSNAVLSLSGEISKEVGEHSISYTLSTDNNNNYSVGTLTYKVIKYCISNSSYNEKTGLCECDSGYINISGVCEVKKSCGSDYRYNEDINTCIVLPKSSQSSSSGGASTSGSSSSSSSGSSSSQGTQGTTQPTTPHSSSGSATCTPSGNSQEALDSAYAQCVSICSSHDNCEVNYNGSVYVATWY